MKKEEIEKLLEENFLRSSDTTFDVKDLIGSELMYIKDLGGVIDELVTIIPRVYETDLGNVVENQGKVILEVDDNKFLRVYVDRCFKDQFITSQKEIIDMFDKIFDCPKEEYREVVGCLVTVMDLTISFDHYDYFGKKVDEFKFVDATSTSSPHPYVSYQGTSSITTSGPRNYTMKVNCV